MRITIVVICLSFLCACSNEPYIDRTDQTLVVSKIENNIRFAPRGAIFTTDEAPVTIPNCTIKKVSVRRNDEDFKLLAFVDLDQTDKITKKGQRVTLYEVQYFFSSTGQRQSLILARIEQ